MRSMQQHKTSFDSELLRKRQRGGRRKKQRKRKEGRKNKDKK